MQHGSIGTFDSAREDRTSYSDRLEQYFVRNDIVAADKKRTILLSSCGTETYQHIRNIVALKKPTERIFTQLVELVPRPHNSRPSTTSIKFNTCLCKQGQSVETLLQNYCI